jgi:dienelactone hydrolase
MALHIRHWRLPWWAGHATLPLVVLVAAALSTTRVSAVTAVTASSPVTFAGSGGVVLHGTVVAPVPDGGRRPGVVLVSGAGPQKGADDLAQAEAFAHGGVASLVYDKRTAGYSQFQRSYSVLAGDALAAVDLLRSRAGVDPAQVGLWGESEGAWVVSLAAARSSDVAFVVTVGAAGETPARQTAWSDANSLRHAGVTGSLVSTVQRTAIRQVVGAGIFPEADYDPLPAWEQVQQPVLALWGQDDQEVPVAESARIIQQALDRGGNRHYTMRVIPGASHAMEVAQNGGFAGGSLLTAPRVTALVPGYPELVTGWIEGLARGVPAAGAQPVPRQGSAAPPRSSPPAPLRGYEAPWVQLCAIVLFLVAFAGGPLVARPRGKRLVSPVRLPARALGVAGLITTLGLPVYLLLLLETAGGIVGPVVGGRPLPWLALQVLATVAAAAAIGVAAIWLWKRSAVPREDRARLALLLAAGAAYVPWAAYWGLLTP